MALLRLSPAAHDVRVARDFCVREVSAVVGAGEPAEDLLDDAAMITSELVTNSIRAGAHRIELQIETGASGIRITVLDDAEGEVVPGVPDSLALNGRGLRIVESLAERWGVTARTTGKSVWAELRMPGTHDRMLDAHAS